MKRLITICLVLGLMLAASDFAQGSFVYAPEDYHPDWEGGATYQRDVFLDFSSQYPVGDPGPIPGAVYSGTDDASLWCSDYVKMFGWDSDYLPSIFEQFDTFSPITSRSGFLGIDYNGGTGSLFGDFLDIHIDNWDRDWLVKHVWVEIVFSPGGTGVSINAPTGYEKTDFLGFTTEYLGDGFFRYAWGATIEPNPEYETLRIIFGPTATPCGDSMLADLYGIDATLIDSIHIATECVPEPATIGLLGLGSLMLVRRKHRR